MCLTLLIGGIGAAVASFIHIPVGALIGSTMAVSLGSLFRLPMHIPEPLRNTAFAAIGCSLGSGISSDFLDLVQAWPVSLCFLTILIVAMLMLSSWVLARFFHLSRATAFLASSPGALSYSLAIAAGGVGDARAVVVIQSVRLVFITAGLPFILDILTTDTGGGTGEAVHLTYLATSILFLLTLGVGKYADKFGLPAAYLICGIVLSGLVHYFELAHGRPQPLFLLSGFVVTGAVIGSRFSQFSLKELRRMAGAAAALICISTLLAAIFALLVSSLLGFQFGQVLVAYAPGGVEAMAAMALALDFDTAFVATHHLYRIVLLFILLPILLRLHRRCRP